MMKSMYFITLFLPTIFYILMIFLIMLSSKINKFHPMKLMLILIFMTFLMSFMMNYFNFSWIPFILFLTMIGGLMVIFMYITSLANNELFKMNLNLILTNFLKILLMLMMLIILSLYFKQYIYFNMNLNNSWINNFNFMNNDQLSFNSMYKMFNNKTSFFIMMYLYYSMICIMNICYKFKAPLRQLSF